MAHGSGTEIGRRLSWITIFFVLFAATSFTVVAAYMVDGAEAAGAVSATAGLAFVVFSILEMLSHLFTYNEIVRGAASRLIPKRWLGMEVDND